MKILFFFTLKKFIDTKIIYYNSSRKPLPWQLKIKIKIKNYPAPGY
jgi:hypothetical protein